MSMTWVQVQERLKAFRASGEMKVVVIEPDKPYAEYVVHDVYVSVGNEVVIRTVRK